MGILIAKHDEQKKFLLHFKKNPHSIQLNSDTLENFRRKKKILIDLSFYDAI